MSKDNFNDRAAKGQALNLAVLVAIKEGKVDNDRFIIKQVGRFLSLSNRIQNTEVEDIIKLAEELDV